MQVIGFNFTKLSGEKIENFLSSSRNINIGFLEITKDKIDLLQDKEVLKVDFDYSIIYHDLEEKKEPEKEGEKKKEELGKVLGKILIAGNIILAVSKDESKEILKTWKDKKISPNIQIPLYNLIFKKCAPKSVYLADESGLPSPVPVQKIQKQ